MSYGSRTQYPSTSRTRRGRGRAQPSYQPHQMNRPEVNSDLGPAGPGAGAGGRQLGAEGEEYSHSHRGGGRGERSLQR